MSEELKFLNQKGQIDHLDLGSDDTGAFNTPVETHSGGGMSYGLEEIVARARELGAAVRVVDRGQSYKKLCAGVDYSHLTDGDLSINPFAQIRVPELNGEDLGPNFGDVIYANATYKLLLGDEPHIAEPAETVPLCAVGDQEETDTFTSTEPPLRPGEFWLLDAPGINGMGSDSLERLRNYVENGGRLFQRVKRGRDGALEIVTE